MKRTSEPTPAGFHPLKSGRDQGKKEALRPILAEKAKPVAVDLRLPPFPKGVDGSRPAKMASFCPKIATASLCSFQGAQNGLGRRQG